MIEKFIKKTLILSFTVAVFLLLVHYSSRTSSRDENAYVGATIDKERLLDSMPSPRIIFVGGSSNAFGQDSKVISDSLRINVLNMGVHLGLGLNFMLNETKAGIKAGDIIIVSTEYHIRQKGNPQVIATLMDSNPPALTYLDIDLPDFLRLISANLQLSFNSLLHHLLKRPKKWNSENIYLRSSFNTYGDMVAHLDRPNKLNIDLVLTLPNNYGSEITALNQFTADAIEKGAKVFFLFPNSPKKLFESQKSAIVKFEKDLRTGLKCPILSDPESLVFPDSLYFDSKYHLNKHGRLLKTQIIIQTLKPVLKDMDLNQNNK